jgi:hypothetical protein
MIKAYTQVKVKFGKPAVKIEGQWFYVNEEVGTKGLFKAHPSDEYAYMTGEDE